MAPAMLCNLMGVSRLPSIACGVLRVGVLRILGCLEQSKQGVAQSGMNGMGAFRLAGTQSKCERRL